MKIQEAKREKRHPTGKKRGKGIKKLKPQREIKYS